MYLSKIAAPLLGLIRPQLSYALKNLRPISSNQMKNCTYSTSTTTTTISDTTKTNPVDEYENLTNNEFENKETAPGSEQSTENKAEVHPLSVAQASNNKYFGWQPNKETHSLLMVDGVPFNKLNTVYINSTKNNTILTLTDHNGLTMYSISAGACGFKNCKKSTAVAGQAAGLAMSDHIKRRGLKNLRVMVKGFGNGRLPSIKALQMSKLQIVSITDQTPIPLMFAKPPRPPVKRRI